MSARARPLRTFLIATGGVAVALAVVVRLPPIQRWVAAQVSAQLGPDVTIDRATIVLLPAPGVRLTAVSISRAGRPVATIPSVRCAVRIAPLLDGQLELASVTIDAPSLSFVREAGGGVHVDSSAGPLLPADRASPAARPMVLPTVFVHDATVDFVDRGVGGEPLALRVHGADLRLDAAGDGNVAFDLSTEVDPAGELRARGTLRNLVSGGRVGIDAAVHATGVEPLPLLRYLPGDASPAGGGSLDLSVTLAGEIGGLVQGEARIDMPAGFATWVHIRAAGPLVATTRFAVQGTALSLSDAEVQAATVSAGLFAAANLSARFDLAGRALQLHDSHFTAYGGRWTQAGTVWFAGEPTFEGDLRAEGAGCRELVAALSGHHSEYGCESFTATALVRGPLPASREGLRALRGSGRLEVRGGSVPSSSILEAIWHVVMPLVDPFRALQPLQEPTRIVHVTESFTLRDGELFTDDLSMITSDYTVTGTGSVGLDGRLDLDTHVALTPAGVSKLLIMASLPMPAGGLGHLPPIQTRITGTLADPQVRPVASDAALRGLLRGATGVGKLLGDAAGAGGRALGDGLRALCPTCTEP